MVTAAIIGLYSFGLKHACGVDTITSYFTNEDSEIQRGKIKIKTQAVILTPRVSILKNHAISYLIKEHFF